jgi:Terpene cyclase DEP1
MTTADQVDQAPSIPTSRKVLCAVYGAIAVAALIATWSQNLAYSDKAAGSFLAFWNDAKVTPASRSLTADLLLFGLAAVIFMVTEARRHGVKFVWIYVAGGYLVAISVAFPLFLIARELRIGMSDAPHLRTTDTILLAVVAILTAGLTVWIDLG